MNLNIRLVLFLLVDVPISFCGTKEVCKTDRFTFKCLTGTGCFPRNKMCDGNRDCSDGSDERNCYSTYNAHHCANYDTQFRCNSGYCINLQNFCDGTQNCPTTRSDNSDEMYCHCDTTEFRCNTSGLHCVALSSLCDGKNDCSDRSDEFPQNCHLRHCLANEFKCKNNRCVEKDLKCNGNDDCGDGSDEERSQCICNQTPANSTCNCPKGFRILSNALNFQNCEDINECIENPGVCDQDCHNTEGNFHCSCKATYRLKSDSRSCIMEGVPPSLLFEWHSSIIVATQDYSSQKPAVFYGDIGGFDVDSHSNTIYWSSAKEGFIAKQSITTGKPTASEKLAVGLNKPSLVSYDWVSSNVYVVTEKNDSKPATVIKVCNIKRPGLGCATIFRLKEEREESHITGLIVLPKQGYVFWTQVATKDKISGNAYRNVGSIWRGTIRDSEVLKLTDQLQNPVGLAIDRVSNRIYWIDSVSKKVEGMNVDGSNRTIIINLDNETWGHVNGLSVYEHSITWMSQNGSITCRVTAHPQMGLSNCSFVKQSSLSSGQFPVTLHHALQPKNQSQDPCLNNSCSFICVGISVPTSRVKVTPLPQDPTPKCNIKEIVPYKCLCPDELFSADEKNQNCLPNLPVEPTTEAVELNTKDTEYLHSDAEDIHITSLSSGMGLSIGILVIGIVLILVAVILLIFTLFRRRIRSDTSTANPATVEHEAEFTYEKSDRMELEYCM